MSESEKKADRESVRVCKWCRCEIVQLPDTRWRSIHGKSVYCAGSDHRKKFHEPLAEPAEPSGGLMSREQKLALLLKHCWIHEGYPKCGYNQMTTEQKAMYDEIANTDYEILAAVGNPRIGAELAEKSDTSDIRNVPPLSNEQPPVPQMGAAFSDAVGTPSLRVVRPEARIAAQRIFALYKDASYFKANSPDYQRQMLEGWAIIIDEEIDNLVARVLA